MKLNNTLKITMDQNGWKWWKSGTGGKVLPTCMRMASGVATICSAVLKSMHHELLKIYHNIHNFCSKIFLYIFE